VVVFNVIQTQGFDGLAIATFMAGMMLVAFGGRLRHHHQLRAAPGDHQLHAD